MISLNLCNPIKSILPGNEVNLFCAILSHVISFNCKFTLVFTFFSLSLFSLSLSLSLSRLLLSLHSFSFSFISCFASQNVPYTDPLEVLLKRCKINLSVWWLCRDKESQGHQKMNCLRDLHPPKQNICTHSRDKLWSRFKNVIWWNSKSV